MTTFPVDMNEYERAGSSDKYIIPDGTYLLEVADVQEKTSQKGLPQLNFKLNLAEFINSQDWIYNRWTYHTITLIPKGERGHGIALHLLKILGAAPDENGLIHIEPSAFIGRRFNAFVFSEKDAQGVLRQRINHIEALPEAAPAVSEAEEDLPF